MALGHSIGGSVSLYINNSYGRSNIGARTEGPESGKSRGTTGEAASQAECREFESHRPLQFRQGLAGTGSRPSMVLCRFGARKKQAARQAVQLYQFHPSPRALDLLSLTCRAPLTPMPGTRHGAPVARSREVGTGHAQTGPRLAPGTLRLARFGSLAWAFRSCGLDCGRHSADGRTATHVSNRDSSALPQAMLDNLADRCELEHSSWKALHGSVGLSTRCDRLSQLWTVQLRAADGQPSAATSTA